MEYLDDSLKLKRVFKFIDIYIYKNIISNQIPRSMYICHLS